jgi:hypothetical protein
MLRHAHGWTAADVIVSKHLIWPLEGYIIEKKFEISAIYTSNFYVMHENLVR